MHEWSVTENILEIVLRHGREAGAHRITDLYLVIGELTTFVDDSVQFYWDFISQDTMAEKARLHFRRVPAEVLCLTCGHAYSLAAGWPCPVCAGSQVNIIIGEEFYVEAIDVLQEEEMP